MSLNLVMKACLMASTAISEMMTIKTSGNSTHMWSRGKWCKYLICKITCLERLLFSLLYTTIQFRFIATIYRYRNISRVWLMKIRGCAKVKRENGRVHGQKTPIDKARGNDWWDIADQINAATKLACNPDCSPKAATPGKHSCVGLIQTHSTLLHVFLPIISFSFFSCSTKHNK